MHKPIVFLGTSTNLEIFIRVCTLRGMPVAGIVDSDFYGNSEIRNGLPVIGSEDTFDFEAARDQYDFFIGTPKNKLSNIAFLYEDRKESKISAEFNAFNNPEHEINFYNKENWQTAEVPSMNGHGNARSIAKIYDIFVNDLILEKNILLSKSSIKKCLTENDSRVDESLMLPIRWSQVGLILRGGWLFGKNKESFGHNGWGGSLGFADPILGIGVAYTTNKINPTMASDQRIINLLKKFYEII